MKLAIPLLLLLVLALPAWAQTTKPYELVWLAFNTNGTASGGQYEVAATLGQLDSSPLSGGDYTVEGHFGIGGVPTATPTATSTPLPSVTATPTPSPTSPQNLLYLPMVTKK